jgi:hypothetical protein
MLHEDAAALSAAGRANRSRRLIKCAKDCGHYPLATAVPVDDRRLKRLAAQLWNLEIYFARAGLKCPLIAAGPGVLTSLAEALMTTVEHAPGGSSAIHRHNAHAFVYVLEGKRFHHAIN